MVDRCIRVVQYGKKEEASCSGFMVVVNGANVPTCFLCTCSDGCTVDTLLISLGLTIYMLARMNFQMHLQRLEFLEEIRKSVFEKFK